MRIPAYAFFYGSLAVSALLALFGLFVGNTVDFLGSMLAGPAFIVGALMVLLYVAIKPTWAKARELLLASAVAAGILSADQDLRTAGLKLFWSLREAQANAFLAELLSYGRIREMDTGDRHFKELNGELVAYVPAEVDISPIEGLRPTLPLARVLGRDGVDPLVYNAFRQRLRSLGFIHVEVRDECITFVRDGILDNLYGFVWLRPGHAAPTPGSEFVDGTQLVLLRPVGRRWYFFVTT